MTLRILAVLLLLPMTAFAQAPRENDRRPEGAAPIQRSQCELLAGAEREQGPSRNRICHGFPPLFL